MLELGYIKREVNVGDVFINKKSKDSYEVIEILPSEIVNNKTIRYVKIRFLATGTERVVKVKNIFAANDIKDPYYPNIAGVACIGVISTSDYDKKMYDMWRNMILRCYDTNHSSYNRYGGAGITVCDRWLCFENFIKDFSTLPGYTDYFYDQDKSKYSLDKDYLQQGFDKAQMIYSPETCCIIKGDTNSRGTRLSSSNTTSSMYRGVHRLQNGNFQCRVMLDGYDCFLGTYDNEIAAANMYNHVLRGGNFAGAINNVPLMTITECLTHKNSNQPIKLPEYVKIKEIEEYNTSQATYQGVINKDGYYLVEYYNNGVRHNGGKYTDKNAAANAYNWFNATNPNANLNNAPYMAPEEWFQYKYYGSREAKPIEMFQPTGEPEEERKARCKARYGIEFL